jgi:hypothetical protein
VRLHFEEGERELLATRLGLDNNADDSAVAQAVAQWMQEEVTTSSDEPNTDTGTPAEANLDELQADSGDFVIVDVTSFRRYQQRDRIAAEVEAATRRRDRDELIEEAIHDGKFSPGRREHYRERYNSDPEGIALLIGRLTPNTVPLEERGADVPTDEIDDTSYPQTWVPEVAARQARPQSRVHGED